MEKSVIGKCDTTYHVTKNSSGDIVSVNWDYFLILTKCDNDFSVLRVF